MTKDTRNSIISAFISLAKQNPQRSSFTMSEIAKKAGFQDKRFIKNIFITMMILSNIFTNKQINKFSRYLIIIVREGMEIRLSVLQILRFL